MTKIKFYDINYSNRGNYTFSEQSSDRDSPPRISEKLGDVREASAGEDFMAELISEVKKFLRRKSGEMSQKKLSLGNEFGKSLQQRAKIGDC